VWTFAVRWVSVRVKAGARIQACRTRTGNEVIPRNTSELIHAGDVVMGSMLR
jgi:hypothetical protein